MTGSLRSLSRSVSLHLHSVTPMAKVLQDGDLLAILGNFDRNHVEVFTIDESNKFAVVKAADLVKPSLESDLALIEDAAASHAFALHYHAV
eukprot:CAMPEP_0185596494 /NCGR_PEP_ID=MMETSP0434-20130131/80790_1 /TAXON_ID=626734 ORGANISM="Favella taraikaensis, Strain Fe Narragansett Bay" /NCGR_SAMPLE_ID=MMETSP0434 /ASSEMBLY_ACC=CAM_ASM_000379 /LENGTH=90 /DNA_ID=CAMNT_0028225009 /DNA_START=85 /DNA_END=357 /DNA_ORIENTATION=-